MYRSLILLLFIGAANAHQMSPTYPKWSDSYIDDISVSRVRVFNKRKDVEYYEIGVFDKDMKPIPFVTQYDLRGIKYHNYAEFTIYINNKYKKDAVYVCSKSMLPKLKSTGVVSKICSKFKD